MLLSKVSFEQLRVRGLAQESNSTSLVWVMLEPAILGIRLWLAVI